MTKKKEDEFIELLSEQEICELHEAFNIFDIESDGYIKANNLILLMNALRQYPSKEEIEQILKEIEINNDGEIYFNQFLKIMAKRLKKDKDDEDKYLKSLFDELDRNKNGLISLHEIKYIVSHSKENEDINDKEIEFMMKEADTDGDGLISFEEFMFGTSNNNAKNVTNPNLYKTNKSYNKTRFCSYMRSYFFSKIIVII